MKNTSKLIAVIVLFAGFISSTRANNLKIENVSYDAEAEELSFDISWENAWHYSEEYHDAVWIFIKYKNANSNHWKHLSIYDANINATGLEFVPVSVNNFYRGFIFRGISQEGQFNVENASVTIEDLLLEDFFNPSFQVFGVEMVYVPEGSFFLGDAQSQYRFVRNESELSSVFKVEENSTTFYSSNQNGDGTFTYDVPENRFVPNGYKAFYCMKYELTQRQYVDFLNSLTVAQQRNLIWADWAAAGNSERFVMSASNSPIYGNGIVWSNPPSQGKVTFGLDFNNNGVLNETEDGQSLACNQLTKSMMLSYLDWSGLRPMSEMEYEKACRGFDRPVQGELAWGTNIYTVFTSDEVINVGSVNESTSVTGDGLVNFGIFRPLRVGFAGTSSTDRSGSAGSYFGIQNLSDNLSELVIRLVEGFSYDFAYYGVFEHGRGTLEDDGQPILWLDLPFITRGGSFGNIGRVSTSTVSYRRPGVLGSSPQVDVGVRGVTSY